MWFQVFGFSKFDFQMGFESDGNKLLSNNNSEPGDVYNKRFS